LLAQGLKPATRDGGIGLTNSSQVHTDAAYAGLGESVQKAFRRIFGDHGYAAGASTARLHAEQCGGIVRAIDAGRYDDHALDVEGAMERGHFVGRRGFRSIGAAGPEGKAFRVAENMRVAVAGVGGNVEFQPTNVARCTLGFDTHEPALPSVLNKECE
jgi:hypothetical protein